MKKLLLVLLILPLFSFAQVTYNISGQAYLSDETDHSSLMFSVINPQNLDTLAVGYPDSTGYYSIDVSPGFYLLNWSHNGHIPQELGNFAFSTDIVLADISLLSGYVQDVCGEVSGVWTSGSVYDVLCDIEVPEGYSLIIESGVRVRFMEGAGMTCYGVLDVLGDSINRVLFTSREASPFPGDWGNVSLYAEGNTISHLDYEFATDGFIGDNVSNTTIDNVVMVGNLSLSANGIYLTNSSDLTLTNNTISVGGEYGIHSPYSPNSMFYGNDISGASTGLYSPDSPNSLVDNNHISSVSTGLYFQYSINSDIQSNDISATNCGIEIYATDSMEVRNNNILVASDFPENWRYGVRNDNSVGSIFQNNSITMDITRGNFAVIGSSDAIIDNNILTGIEFDCWWGSASYAINSARSVITNNIIDFENLNGCTWDGAYALISHGSQDVTSIIHNNVITTSGYEDANTRGIYASYADLQYNVIDTRGTSIYFGSYSSGSFNTISSSSIAIESNNVDSIVITNNTISSNSTAINLSGSDVLISYNQIESQGRGIAMYNQSGGEVSNNTIISPNSADYGIHISNLSAPVVQNNIIEGFTNGIYAENDLQNQFIQNNNFWDISEDLFSGTAMPSLIGEMIDMNNNADTCDIYSNLNMDPLFVNPDSSDYNLQANSPCINAGHQGSALDPDGTIADMGAFFSIFFGCMDSTSFNYSPLANYEDGSCVSIILGCTDTISDNYSELANTDDGSCYLSGCIYEWAINYDSLATVDDGSCINDIYGCTSELSDNYDSLATVDNGSCFRYGCLSYWADNYDDLATEDDGSCFKLGCMYTYASNYDSEATQDDGLCIYTCTPPSYWEYSTTDVNHTVMILEDFLTDINGFPLASGSLIGVFYPDENGDMQCAGSTIFVGETTFIAVMGDDQTTEELDGFPTGQELSLMVWDTESCQEYQVNGSFEGSSSFNPNDITILTSIATNSLCQLMDIPSGWSMFSTYMIADDMDMTTVLFPMVENLIMVKDNDGTAYLPEFSFNGIGDFQVGQGYQIKTATDVSFEICGSYALPEDHPIALSQGWNLIGYLRTQSSDAIAVLSDISDAENLIILKDYDGVPYLPEFNFNGIGDMHPGEGYQLKVYESDTLEYLSNDASYRFSSHEVIDNKSSHFQRVSNTDQNMTVVIEDASWGVIPSLGSEIAAYNKEGTLVGSALYTSPVTVLTVWGDDAMTSIKEGMSLDENVSFKLWDTETTQEFEVVKWIAGSSSYQKDVINVASSIIATLIESSNTESTRVLVKIVNVLGQEVDLVDNTLKGVVLFEVYDDGSVELKVH